MLSSAHIICLAESQFTVQKQEQYQIPGYAQVFLPAAHFTNTHGLAVYWKTSMFKTTVQVKATPSIELLHLKIDTLEILLLYRSIPFLKSL